MKKPYTRSGIRFYLIALALLLGQSTPVTILAGLPILYLGALLHLWSKGCLKQNRELTRTGPYRFVRHPFYLAYLLIDIGILVMSGSWVLAAVFPWWWLFIYIPTIRKEEAYLEKLYPEEQKAFRQSIPALFPYRKPLPKSGVGFSWNNSNIASDTEISRLLHILAYPFLFFVVYRLRNVGIAFFANDGPGDIFSLTLMLSLYGASWITRQHFKRGQRIIPRPLTFPAFRLLLIVATLSTAILLNVYEITPPTVPVLIGLLLIAFAPVLSLHPNRKRYLFAEMFALAGALTLCRIPWLTPVVLLFYTAILLDTRQDAPSRDDPTTSNVLVELRAVQPALAYLTILGAIIVAFVEIYVLSSLL